LKIPYVNEFLLRRNYSNYKAFITSPRLEGIAVWIPSEKMVKISFWRIVTSGAMWPAIRIGLKALKKLRVYDQYIKRKHEELVPYLHFYLAILAVDPKYQGKGYASKLLNAMLSELDNKTLPCYVETEGARNVAIYLHFGFGIIDEFDIPNTNDRLIAMLRQPKEKEDLKGE
jgi:ribosomal protein S18 acetylase RimI-like enzyme